jgi:hypothetical protein
LALERGWVETLSSKAGIFGRFARDDNAHRIVSGVTRNLGRSWGLRLAEQGRSMLRPYNEGNNNS